MSKPKQAANIHDNIQRRHKNNKTAQNLKRENVVDTPSSRSQVTTDVLNTKSDQLSNNNFQTAQRQLIAQQIGHLQGNRHIQRAITEPLPTDKRLSLERITGDRLTLANTAFVSACKDVARAMKEAAKAKAEMAALFIDIATGFLAPGLGKGIANLANRLPMNATTTAYRVAIAALDTDRTKALFTGGMKAAQYLLKSNATALFGETETDAFITALEIQSQAAFQATSDTLGQLSDEELGVVCAAHDASVTNVGTYREKVQTIVSAFENQVLPISKGEWNSGRDVAIFKEKRAFWVRWPDGKTYLNLLDEGVFSSPYASEHKYEFVSVIWPEMANMAIEKTKEINEQAGRGKVIQTVDVSQVEGATK